MSVELKDGRVRFDSKQGIRGKAMAMDSFVERNAQHLRYRVLCSFLRLSTKTAETP